MKKIKVLAITLIIAFAFLGGAYALWYDSLYIDETIDTGVLNIQWDCISFSDDGENYQGYPIAQINTTKIDGMEKANPAVRKNIGSSAVSEDADSEETDGNLKDLHNGSDSLTLVLQNSYPGYQEDFLTYIKNNGTVPVKLQNLKLVPDTPDNQVPDFIHLQIVNLKTNDVYFDNKNTYTPIDGIQIDPGCYLPVRIFMRVLDGAPQNYNYDDKNLKSFTFQVEGIQWNAFNYDQDPNSDNHFLNTIDAIPSNRIDY